jgi:hypothetical protein
MNVPQSDGRYQRFLLLATRSEWWQAGRLPPFPQLDALCGQHASVSRPMPGYSSKAGGTAASPSPVASLWLRLLHYGFEPPRKPSDQSLPHIRPAVRSHAGMARRPRDAGSSRTTLVASPVKFVRRISAKIPTNQSVGTSVSLCQYHSTSLYPSRTQYNLSSLQRR